MKLTTYAWNVYDGRQKLEVSKTPRPLLPLNSWALTGTGRISEGDSDPGDASAPRVLWLRVSPAHARSLLLLTRLFWCTRFYFPAFLVGPALTFSEYTALITETLYDGAVATPNGSKRVPFGRKRVAYQRLALSLVCMGGFAVYGSTFSHQVMLTEWWMTKSFVYRWVV